ncbi:Hypothetical predicted protein [Xyrichtys novacula]|uniref:Uncharacterized protein n=1 Tax=Xyrichtys novacula TaxID=13765 RepID=A0AAV1FM53_XYRNO|nr:Hypothetical predicted protein [Xyrichtys novacula]
MVAATISFPRRRKNTTECNHLTPQKRRRQCVTPEVAQSPVTLGPKSPAPAADQAVDVGAEVRGNHWDRPADESDSSYQFSVSFVWFLGS